MGSGGFSILVLRVYYDVYYSRLIHYMYIMSVSDVYDRYRNVIANTVRALILSWGTVRKHSHLPIRFLEVLYMM